MKVVLRLFLFTALVGISAALRYECDQRNVSCGCGFKNTEINLDSATIESAIPYSWPMVVSIRFDCRGINDPHTHCCTGTLLNDLYVLTAASCFPPNETNSVVSRNVTIVAGVHRLDQQCQTVRRIDRISIHPNWTNGPGRLGQNMALLRLADSLDFDMEVLISPTCLPSTTNTNTTLALVGWNHPEEQVLQQMSVYATESNGSECARETNSSDARVLCVHRAEASCFPEVGSPLFQWLGNRWELIGIQSLALNTCLCTGYAGLFTRLLGSDQWIDSILNHRPTATTSLATTTTTTRNNGTTPTVYSCDRRVSCGCSYSDVSFNSSSFDQIEDAVDHSWSMIVSLRSPGTNEHSCAGTLLSRSHILTTASCLRSFSLSNGTIYAGITNLSDSVVYTRTIEAIFVHPNYTDAPRHLHNIVVLRMNRPFIFQNNPILARSCIARTNDTISINGTNLVMIGWNINQSLLLKQIQIIGKDARCLNATNDDQLQFCAGRSTEKFASSDSCLGDLGGSVFFWTGRYWTQVGLVAHPSDCSQTRSYTRLSAYWPWIEDILIRDNETLEPTTTSTTTVTVSRTSGTTRTTRTTTRTTSTPVKRVIHECDRRPNECGCGLKNVDHALENPSSEEIAPQSWSMMVSIRVNDNEHLCCGTILSDLFVLTAAHCVVHQSTTNNLSVVAGIDRLSQNSTFLRRVDRIFLHENYTQQNGSIHDLAILQLDRSLDIGRESSLAQTCLPNKTEDDAILMAVGWPRSDTDRNVFDHLHQISVRLFPTCANSTYDPRYQFCAGISANQTNPFGEALFIYRERYWEQLGIRSKIHQDVSLSHSGVYVRLAAYTDWIQRIMQNTSIPIRKPSVRNGAVGKGEPLLLLMSICILLLIGKIKGD